MLVAPITWETVEFPITGMFRHILCVNGFPTNLYIFEDRNEELSSLECRVGNHTFRGHEHLERAKDVAHSMVNAFSVEQSSTKTELM